MSDAPDPGPAPDRSPSEAYLRRRLVGAGDTVEVQSGAVEAVLAELDRQRALIAAVLAECARRESVFSGPAYTEKWVETHTIRALLDEEDR